MASGKSYFIGREYSKNEYILALKRILSRTKIPENVIQMLRHHYAAPNRKLGATEIAELVPHKNYKPINLFYGQLGKDLCDELAYIPPIKKDGRPNYICGIAYVEQGPNDKKVWIMYNNLANALKELGIVP